MVPSVFNSSFGYINLALGKGDYNVQVEWINPLEGIEVFADSIKLAHGANLNGNTSVDLQDVSLLSRMIDEEIATGVAADTIMDIDNDGDIDWDDYSLLSQALDTIKDINADGVVDATDVEKMEYVVRLEEIPERTIPEATPESDPARHDQGAPDEAHADRYEIGVAFDSSRSESAQRLMAFLARARDED